MRRVSATTLVAGVAGAPVKHSLSPLIHNAWLEAAGIDGVYVAFAPPRDSFAAFAQGLAGGAIRGLNVTAPFKETALEIATLATDRARRAGAANLILFEQDGRTCADNTDGEGLIGALKTQAPAWRPDAGPVVILGAFGRGEELGA
jgi:shikimate dehydrogenase